MNELKGFFIGLTLTLFFAIASLTLFNTVTGYLSKTYSYTFNLDPTQQIMWASILFGLDNAAPILVGKLWKSKTSWYWLGMVIALILYCGATFLWDMWNALQSIGSNPF